MTFLNKIKDGFLITLGMAIGVILGISLLIGLSIIHQKIQDSGLKEMYEACDEYCFHQADQFMADTTGMTWNHECICADGSIGWFD